VSDTTMMTRERMFVTSASQLQSIDFSFVEMTKQKTTGFYTGGFNLCLCLFKPY